MTATDTSDMTVVDAPVASLQPSPENPRLLSASAFESLKKSLDHDPDMLRARPLIALPDGTVIAGNMRLRAAMALGWATIPTVYVDLDAARAREWMIRDNNEWGDWQTDELAQMLYEMQQGGAALATLGFRDDEMNALLDQVGALGDTIKPDPTAPDEFAEVDPDTMETDHRCPKCGYEWSGKAV